MYLKNLTHLETYIYTSRKFLISLSIAESSLNEWKLCSNLGIWWGIITMGWSGNKRKRSGDRRGAIKSFASRRGPWSRGIAENGAEVLNKIESRNDTPGRVYGHIKTLKIHYESSLYMHAATQPPRAPLFTTSAPPPRLLSLLLLYLFMCARFDRRLYCPSFTLVSPDPSIITTTHPMYLLLVICRIRVQDCNNILQELVD